MKNFSTREVKLLNILNKRKMTIKDLAYELFKGDKEAPMDQEITISNSVRRIVKKCEFYKLDWTLVKQRIDGQLYVLKSKGDGTR